MAHDFPSHAGGRFSQYGIREAGAIIRDGQECFALCEIQHDVDPRGGTVANGILDGFLGDPEKMGGRLGIKVRQWTVDVRSTGNPVECCRGLGEFLKRAGEVAILQIKGSEAA